MRTITVKELAAPTGYDLKIAAGETLDLKSQGTVTMPTGSILQVVESQMEGSTVTTTSSSFVATGHSVTITPSLTSSKILLQIQGGGSYLPQANTMARVTIYRGSTNIGHSSKGLESHYTVGSTGFTVAPHAMGILDSPSTTSAITYQAYMKTDGGTFQYQANDRGIISFIAMEVAG